MKSSIVTAVLLVVYFVPSIVAASRSLKRARSIAFINLVLGWTLVGWVLALCWAVARTERDVSQ